MKKPQNTKAIDEWQAQNVDKILLKPRKYEHLPERIQMAIESGKAKSRQEYIIGAVKQRLDVDGIPEMPDIVKQYIESQKISQRE